MPWSRPRACAMPGCAGVTTGRFCADHQEQDPREERARKYDYARRDDPNRIYNCERWRALSLKVIHRDPLCRACGEDASQETDHIIPIRAGGAKWDMGNLQGLCKTCHSRKTSRETHPPAGAGIPNPIPSMSFSTEENPRRNAGLFGQYGT